MTYRKYKFKSKGIITIVVAIMLLTGAVWQYSKVNIEKETFTPVGSFADLGNYKAHYYSKGDGDVAFVFISGSGTPCAYTDFYKLQNMMSVIGLTITFDHAGSGWSERADAARTIDNLVNELTILIGTVAPNRPIVLVCHSLGSLEAIAYTQANPEKVKGIVFLDSGSPEFYSEDSEILATILNRGSALIRTIGLNRLLCEIGAVLPLYGENIRYQNIPQEVKELDKVMYYRYAGNSATLDTIQLINENAAKVLSNPLLGDIPILVLSSDSGDEWKEVQYQLSSWSIDSEQVTIENSAHYIYWSNYGEVSNYIDSFLTRIME